MKLNPNQILFVHGGLGRLHRVTAVFTDTASANAYLSATPAESVIAVFDSIVLIAAVSDLGTPLPPTARP